MSFVKILAWYVHMYSKSVGRLSTCYVLIQIMYVGWGFNSFYIEMIKLDAQWINAHVHGPGMVILVM